MDLACQCAGRAGSPRALSTLDDRSITVRRSCEVEDVRLLLRDGRAVAPDVPGVDDARGGRRRSGARSRAVADGSWSSNRTPSGKARDDPVEEGATEELVPGSTRRPAPRASSPGSGQCGPHGGLLSPHRHPGCAPSRRRRLPTTKSEPEADKVVTIAAYGFGGEAVIGVDEGDEVTGARAQGRCPCVPQAGVGLLDDLDPAVPSSEATGDGRGTRRGCRR